MSTQNRPHVLERIRFTRFSLSANPDLFLFFNSMN